MHLPGRRHGNPMSGRPSLGWRHRSRRQEGQGLVEFALSIPIFLVLFMGVLEFGFVFNALLSINFATRDAALIAAEAGSMPALDASNRDVGGDCIILKTVDADVTAPADRTRITQVRIYRSNLAGAQMGSSVNVYQPGGSTTCTYTSGDVTVPYTMVGAVGYPGSGRCDIVAGCPNDVTGTHPGLDTIGVSIGYSHLWKTPMSRLIGDSGTGYNLLKANATRMEPIL